MAVLSRAAARAALALCGVACGGTLSNQIFADDAAFLDALPSRDVFQIAYTEAGAPAVDEDDADLYVITTSAVQIADRYLLELTGITDALHAIPPAERAQDLRRWGPYEWSDGARGQYIQVEMVRSPAGGSYSTTFSIDDTASGPFTSFFSGVHYVGDTVADGTGWAEWDLGDSLQGEGQIYLEYDLREGLSVLVDLDGVLLASESGEPASGTWTYAPAAGGGAFEYITSLELFGGDLQERLELRSRWLADGSGRADARGVGGDLQDAQIALESGLIIRGEATLYLTQCWDAGGAVTAQVAYVAIGAADQEWLQTVGDPEADCPFLDEAGLSRLAGWGEP